MSKRQPTQASFPGVDEQGDAEELRRVIQAAGLDRPLPACTLMSVPFGQITIPREHALNWRKVREMAISIKTLGRLLQPPSLGLDPASRAQEINHPETRYRVLCGRHRVASDRLVAEEQNRTTGICLVYHEVFSPPLAAVVSAVEQFQRGEDWRNEVAEIRELIDERVGMTVPMLAATLGLRRPMVQQRLALAQKLIAPLFEQVVSNKKISLTTATRMARLTREHQSRLVALLAQGKPLTDDMVSEEFLAQINGDLAASAPTFLSALDLKVDASGRVTSDAGAAPASPAGQKGHEGPDALIGQLLPLVTELQGYALPGQLAGLTEFFKQELERWQRERLRAVQREEVLVC